MIPTVAVARAVAPSLVSVAYLSTWVAPRPGASLMMGLAL